MCFHVLRGVEKHLGDDEKKYDRVFWLMAFGLLAIQIVSCAVSDFQPRNDLSYICQGAYNSIVNGADTLYEGIPEWHKHYFAVYTNNHMLYFIVYVLYKAEYLLTGSITNILPMAVNICGLNLSYILMYRSAKIIYSPAKALSCAVRGLMFTPIFTYSAFFYTDSMSMPYLSLAVYLYLKHRKLSENSDCKNNRLKSFLLMTGCMAALAAAYKIKGSAGIFLCAAVIDIFLRQRKKPVGALLSILSKLADSIVIITVFAVFCTAFSALSSSVLKIDKEELEEYKFPAIHWIMMSADGRGGYQSEDFFYTKSFDGYDNKVAADIDRLIEKIENQGWSGFILHLCKKLQYVWPYGWFMVGYYLGCFIFRSVPFVAITSILHFALLLTILRSFTTKIKSKDDVLSGNFVLKLTFIGITIFLMIWEARNRYLVSFFILFALV